MKYFQQYFPEVVDWDKEEVKVLCPFHDDTRPSMSINTRNNIFNCFVCNAGGTEEHFISKVNNISLADAITIKATLEGNPQKEWDIHKGRLWANQDILNKVKDTLKLSTTTIDELNLGLVEEDSKFFLAIPVFYNTALMDIRKMNLLKYTGIPKVRSMSNTNTGFVIPFDIWKDDNRLTYILEGEKDMMLARELGLNAITLTGGAGAELNDYMLNSFKNKEIVICYDNDEPGRKGMLNLAKQIKDIVKSVKYINIGDVVSENKEDFFDYIEKYDGDSFCFGTLTTYDFDFSEENKKEYTTLTDVFNNNIIEKEVNSVVIVSSEFTSTYITPTAVSFKKVKDDDGEMAYNDELIWQLNMKYPIQMLELIEEDAKKKIILAKLRAFAGVPPKEEFIETKIIENSTIFKAIVTDGVMVSNSVFLEVYTFEKMEVGIKYNITYRLYPHPTKHQKLVAIVTKMTKVSDLSDFKPIKQLLNAFKSDENIKDRIERLYQSSKHYVAKHMDFNIWFMTDLVFNSILEFDYDGLIRGTLDIFILGDTQVGKSETTSKLTELYNFGHFLSLKTSTTLSLIGGSNKVDGGNCNTIGAIPRQHKGLVVLEEFSGAKYDFIKTITDLRSSGRLRLARVSGEIDIPCIVRMISISNPVNAEDGSPRFLNTFPNGIEPISELIKSAEDVTRYDAFLLAPKKKGTKNPFELELKGTPIEKRAYEHKINWVVTRKSEDVMFDEGIKSYIWEQSERLNELFECNFPLFGTTTAKKLARFSVALATLIMNTDETFTKVIVTKEIVDYIVEFLIGIYDNDYFKLNTYKKEYVSYTEYTPKDILELEQLYPKFSVLFDGLYNLSKTDRNALKMVSGLVGDDFNPIFNKMFQNKWIRVSGNNVYPTLKFRETYKKINKEFTINTVNLINDLGGEIE